MSCAKLRFQVQGIQASKWNTPITSRWGRVQLKMFLSHETTYNWGTNGYENFEVLHPQRTYYQTYSPVLVHTRYNKMIANFSHRNQKYTFILLQEFKS